MSRHAVILGAGFGGLELSARLSESLADRIRITLIDAGESFSFGFSKLDVMLGRATAADVRVPYSRIAIDGVEFRNERVTAIDPEHRRVTTDAGAYDADVLAIALGAEYDLSATPGFEQGGFEYYSVAGAEQISEVLPTVEQGRILIGILGHPFKCPPAPFEGALLIHDVLTERGVRDAVEIRTLGPMSAPVPITSKMSRAFLTALGERGIEYVPDTQIVALDTDAGEARLADGEPVPYDLFVGVPVHRVPEVVQASGLAVDGWVPVDRANLMTRFPDVYAFGDVAALPVAKAGAFAEAAARVVAEDIAARLRGAALERPYQGAGHCFIEFGGGRVGKVEANFLGGPNPTARLVGPSLELAAEKEEFAAARRARWFGYPPASSG